MHIVFSAPKQITTADLLGYKTPNIRTTLYCGIQQCTRCLYEVNSFIFTCLLPSYTGCTQKNGAVSKRNKEFISHFTRAQRTPSTAVAVQVSHALPAVRFSCLMRGRGASFQDGVAAGKGFLCAPF